MNIYIFLIIIILLYIYISYYYRYPADTKILHADMNTFNSNLLYEKHPIVLLNNNNSLEELKKKIFQYSFSSSPKIVYEQWNKNKYKYLIIQPTIESEIYLLPASKEVSEQETIITLQMKPDQLLILPFHWKYHITLPVNSLGIHDLISWMLP
jgi:hypothetical protein